MKALIRNLIFISLYTICFLSFINTFESDAYADRVIPTENVKTSALVRHAPDRESSIAGRIRPGDSAIYLETKGEWNKVVLENGIVGYTHNSVYRLVPDVESLSITPKLIKDSTSILSNNFKSLLSSITLTNKKLDTIATNINSISGDQSSDWRLVLIFISLFFGALGILISSWWNRESKTLDLMQSFQQRYDKLMLVDVNDVKDDRGYYRFLERVWNLQLEQFEYWLQGYIKDDIYILDGASTKKV